MGTAVYGICATCGGSLEPKPTDAVDGYICTIRDNLGEHHNRCWGKPARDRITELEAALRHFTTAFDMYFENGPTGRQSPKFFDSALDEARSVLRNSK
jgi:hypothetical protein